MKALPLLESVSVLDVDSPRFLNPSRLASVAMHYREAYIAATLFASQIGFVRRYMDSSAFRPKDF